MKKWMTSLLAIVMCIALAAPVMAADFVKSVTYKPAPELVSDDDGIVGHIVDEDGNILSDEHEDCFLITPIAESDSLGEKYPEAQELLEKTYEEFTSGEKKLSDVPGLNELAEKELGEGKTGDDFVIRDFFDIMILCDDYPLLKEEGNTIDLTFDVGIASGAYMVAMVYIDGEWQLVELKNNGDGTVTGTFEDVCPVAFLVPADSIVEETPTTGDNNFKTITTWSVVAILALGAMVAAVTVYRRKMEK